VKIALVYDLVYPFSKGGVEKRVWDISHLLSDRNHELHVVGTKYWDGPDDLIFEGIHFRGVCSPVAIHNAGGRRSIKQGIRFAYATVRLLARERFDVVDVQGMALLTCLAVLAVRVPLKINLVVTWYEVWRSYWREYLGTRGYAGRLIEWLVARWSPRNATVSRLTLARLREMGVRCLSWVPIGIDYPRIQAVEPSSQHCDVLYVGRLAGHKNLDLLIDAMVALRDRGLMPTVVIVGDGPGREDLEQRVTSSGLTNIQFLGEIEDETEVLALMKSAGVFAFPSVREGFGLAALEAAACGTPVVAVTHPNNATSELLADRITGRLTNVDARDYAEALEELLTDSDFRNVLGERARIAAEAFDWSHLANDVEQLYSALPPRSDKLGAFRSSRVAS
jgi:L-malate glycosyltransferase